MPAGQASSLGRIDTIYSADSIEWCPHAPFRDIFTCGTYQVLEPDVQSKSASGSTSTLQPKTGGVDGEADGVDGEVDGRGGVEDMLGARAEVGNLVDEDEDVEEGEGEQGKRETNRTGRMYLFQVGDGQSLEELQRIETAAILDTKWAPRLDPLGRPIAAVADARGCITLYAVSSARRLHPIQTIQVASRSTLCLSLDWSPFPPSDLDGAQGAGVPDLIVSLSDGHLAHLSGRSSSAAGQEGDAAFELEVQQTWKAHDFEPWITAFDKWDPHVVWSGGDDCKLKRWDLRSTSFPTLVNKAFDAGVTTITPSPHTPHLLAVGSYDSHLRLFDARNARQPIADIDVGGGIWRARFHPDPRRAGDILLACMHDGFKVVRLDPGLSRVLGGHQHQAQVQQGEQDEMQAAQDEGCEGCKGCRIVTRFDAHASLAYGADWSRLPSGPEGSLVASCSFYDHTMHLWRG